MNWLEVFGWLGSAVVVISLMLGSSKQFRWWNFTGCALATAYNGIIEVWPFFAMNFIIALIDAYWLVRIYREERQLAATKTQTVKQALAAGAEGDSATGNNTATEGATATGENTATEGVTATGNNTATEGATATGGSSVSGGDPLTQRSPLPQGHTAAQGDIVTEGEDARIVCQCPNCGHLIKV